MEQTAEGSPLRLAERRTLTFANRKIVIGSTPTFTDTSAVLKAYSESDQRIFECPCPRCGAFFELMWEHIVWPEGEPEKAECECPHCHGRVSEREKPGMVAAGQWRTTKPEVKGHAGFRLNALISLLANASWAKLAQEFLQAKSDPQELQTFVNTFLGQGWQTPSVISESALAARAEPFDLDHIPPAVLILTAGCDVQDDRVEVSIVGWSRDGEAFILAHVVIWGPFTTDEVWSEVDDFLRTRWRHPHGGMLKIDCALIDASDGDHYDAVLRFTIPRIGRRIFASKGLFGARPIFAMSTSKRLADRLALVGVDTIKGALFDKLSRARGIRFSKSLEPSFYEQLASERRVVRYVRGMPARRFERIGRQRAEALDCLTYATAAKEAIKGLISFDRREAELRGRPIARRPITDFLAGAGPRNPTNVPASFVGSKREPWQ
jgi:phage terminase large subunit GpA-like protein